jgi:cytochrome c oxidase cbb3-type subunit III
MVLHLPGRCCVAWKQGVWDVLRHVPCSLAQMVVRFRTANLQNDIVREELNVLGKCVRKFSCFLVSTVIVGSAALLLTAQEPQTAPPPVKTPEQAAGAGDGPHPGPAQTPSDKRGGGNRADLGQKFFGLAAAPDPAAVDRGQKLFVANCAFCHGSAATGGNSGPNLVRSVLVLHDEGKGTEIGPVILNGRVDKGMPKFPFSDTQIKDIAAFLLSRSQAAVDRFSYKTFNINTGDPKAGQTYFQAHCVSCHSGTGDLAHVATKYEPEGLLTRILYPAPNDRGRNPGPPKNTKAVSTVTVTTPTGQSTTGLLEDMDDFTVSLIDASGEHHSWSREEPGLKVEVHDPLKAHQELLEQYTDADMHNVLAYLETLK